MFAHCEALTYLYKQVSSVTNFVCAPRKSKGSASFYAAFQYKTVQPFKGLRITQKNTDQVKKHVHAGLVKQN